MKKPNFLLVALCLCASLRESVSEQQQSGEKTQEAVTAADKQSPLNRYGRVCNVTDNMMRKSEIK